MTETEQVPRLCPRVITPWPITLGDAQDLYTRKIPDSRYLKRMRIENSKSSNSLMNFIIRKSDSNAILSDEARKAALQRREDYVSDDEYCEACNKSVIYNAREASCVCTRCGYSRNHQAVDTSFREGQSLHTRKWW